MAGNTTSTPEKNIGFVGLGVMGEPMCLNLAKKVRSNVIGFDLSPNTLERLANNGVVRATSLATMAGRCDLIFLSLPNGDAVKAVCCDVDGVAFMW